MHDSISTEVRLDVNHHRYTAGVNEVFVSVCMEASSGRLPEALVFQ